jgi:hypothetical protein
LPGAAVSSPFYGGVADVTYDNEYEAGLYRKPVWKIYLVSQSYWLESFLRVLAKAIIGKPYQIHSVASFVQSILQHYALNAVFVSIR